MGENTHGRHLGTGSAEGEEVAPEEHLGQTDDTDRTDLDPEEQLNRPDQPDFDPREKEPFVGERAIADADRPEDR